MAAVLRAENVFKTYRTGSVVVPALRGVSISVEEGDFIAIMGPSGSGKTTLMNILGLLDRPDEGEVYVRGRATSGLSDDELSSMRLRSIGFVFQQYNLIPVLSALENVELPMVLAGLDRRRRRERAVRLLEEVGVPDVADRRPGEMSGGQQQRVAIARALANEPDIVLADEPTGNLDTESSREVIGLMKALNEERGVTFIVVTHDVEIARMAEKVFKIRDGRLHGVEGL
ncbi:MAG: ABC transporter ATP-binding protein [Thermococci archaeon]|nr:ABC transporter ATP-binding protein [Thermococci archaeon]